MPIISDMELLHITNDYLEEGITYSILSEKYDVSIANIARYVNERLFELNIQLYTRVKAKNVINLKITRKARLIGSDPVPLCFIVEKSVSDVLKLSASEKGISIESLLANIIHEYVKKEGVLK